jgi:hypothetical protein
MDSIKQYLYDYYNSGQKKENWDENHAKKSAQSILEMIEEYQSPPTIKFWRASD